MDREKAAELRSKVATYLRELPPQWLGLEERGLVEVLGMTPGSYNLNFHVRVAGHNFLFRINIEPQSGLAHQVEYEYRVLRFLEGHGIAPRAYHMERAAEAFGYGVMVEEFLEGRHLVLEGEAIEEVARLLARLHGLRPQGAPFITWQDPLAETRNLVLSDLESYRAKRQADPRMVRLAEQLMEKCKPRLRDGRGLFLGECVNHTDVVCDNFIAGPNGLRMIDWEKPRVDDRSYDLGCFLSEPAQRWCLQRVMGRASRRAFMETYAAASGEPLRVLEDKVAIREPLISLHWILWGATKLLDLGEQRTPPELVQAHEEKTARFQTLARPEQIEKLLDEF